MDEGDLAAMILLSLRYQGSIIVAGPFVRRNKRQTEVEKLVDPRFLGTLEKKKMTSPFQMFPVDVEVAFQETLTYLARPGNPNAVSDTNYVKMMLMGMTGEERSAAIRAVWEAAKETLEEGN